MAEIIWTPKTGQATRRFVTAALWTLEIDGDIRDRSGGATGQLCDRMVKRLPDIAEQLKPPPSQENRPWMSRYSNYVTKLLQDMENGARTSGQPLIARAINGKRTIEIVSLMDPADLPPAPTGFDLNGWPAHPTAPEPDPDPTPTEPDPEPDDLKHGHDAHVLTGVDKLRALAEAGPSVPVVYVDEPDPEPIDIGILIPRDDSSADDKLLMATALINRAMLQYRLEQIPNGGGTLLDRLGDAVAEAQLWRQRYDTERQAKENAQASANAARAMIDGLKRQNAQLESNMQAALRGKPMADDPASRELLKLITGTPGSTKGDQTSHGHRGVKHRG